MGSEAGVQTFKPDEIKEKGRLKPGKMLLVDTMEGKIYYDKELKARLLKTTHMVSGSSRIC